MVWSDRGKRGVRSGNTVRNTDFLGKGVNLLLRSEEVSAEVTREDLFSSWDIDDGIPANSGQTFRRNFPHNGHRSGLVYSLDKKKRWEKIEDIKDWIQADKEEEEAPKVVLVERLVGKCRYSGRATRGVCVGVYDSQLGVRKPRKKVSHVSDLLQKDTEPKIIYEACTTSSFQLYPDHNASVYKYRDDNSHKASMKQKGHRKRRLFGNETEQSMNRACADSGRYGAQVFRGRNGKVMYKNVIDKRMGNTDSKQSMIDKDSFSKLSTSNKDNKGTLQSVLSLEELLEKSRQQQSKGKGEGLCANSKANQFKRYGKGDSVYLPVQDSEMPFREPIPEQATKESVTWTTADEPISLDIETQSIQPEVLKKHFGCLYKESPCSPGRKFAVKVELQPTADDNSSRGHAYVLCESQNCVLAPYTSLQWRVFSTGFSEPDVSESILNTLQQLAVQRNILTMPHVVDELLRNVQQVYVQRQEDVKSYNLELKAPKHPLSSSNAWFDGLLKSQADVLTEVEAMAVLEKSVQEREALDGSLGDNTHSDHKMKDVHNECGICYREQVDPEDTKFSSLKACQHLFCISCWKDYAVMSIASGRVDFQCPAYDCKQPIDDVFLMSLLPAQAFSKYLDLKHKRLLELDDKFKWCPGNACNSVAMATMATSKGNCGVKCKCGLLWCFECQENIHWPATCAEYSEFCKVSKHYKELAMDKDLITHVHVKNCPKCNYPIEKNGGCPHMYCILCKTSYCWTCLSPFDCYPYSFVHDCKKKDIKEIQLTFDENTTLSKFFMLEAVKNCLAHKTLHSGQARRDLTRYCQLSLTVQDNWNSTPSKTELRSKSMRIVLDSLETPDCADIVQKAFIFCEQSYFLLEHFAISLSLSKRRERSRKSLAVYDNLKFLVSRVEVLVRASIAEMSKPNVQKKLSMYLKFGKKCQKDIDIITKRRMAQIKQ